MLDSVASCLTISSEQMVMMIDLFRLAVDPRLIKSR